MPAAERRSTFRTYNAFDTFAQSVRSERRFAHDPAGLRFLSDLREGAKSRVRILREGHPLWRAQIGCGTAIEHMSGPDDDSEGIDFPVDGPYAAERMTPDPNLVGDGRLNPRRIAYLYLAQDEATAIAEVRPWLGAQVSVGVFEVLRDCRVVDCFSAKSPFLYGMSIGADGTLIDPPEDQWDEVVWGQISHAFAVPTDPHDSNLTYAPTQILAEVLRDAGYDGVAYRSAMRSQGLNVALFDVSSARLFACHLKRVDSIEYRYSASGPPYSLGRTTTSPPASAAASTTTRHPTSSRRAGEQT